MRAHSIHIIEIVSGVVSLQAVSHLHQKDMLRTIGLADAVHIGIDGEERPAHLVTDVSRVEPGAVYVIGRQHGKGILTVLEGPMAGHQEKCCAQQQEMTCFHTISCA